MNKFPLLRAGQGMEITLAGNCIEFSSTVAPPIVARITGTAGTNDAGATIYTWEEMSPDTTGSAYEVTRGGRTGDGTSNPAYELNDATAETGTIVLLRVRGSGTDSQGQAIYEFSLGGGGGKAGRAAILLVQSAIAGESALYLCSKKDWDGTAWVSSSAVAKFIGSGTPVLNKHYLGVYQTEYDYTATNTVYPLYGVPLEVEEISVVTDITCTEAGLIVTSKTYAIPWAYEVTPTP